MTEPLFLEPSYHPRIWGGRRLESVLGYRGMPEGPIGEAWGISAHPHGPSRIRGGRYDGRTLPDIWESEPALFGSPLDRHFPLLVKFLDARDWLSVQVHPNNAEAVELEGVPLGKTECWYVIAADPGAELILGHNASDPAELSDQIDSASWDQLLLRRPVQAGDFVYVPSGTIHAVGPGMLICEVQQNCDTTYRVYDFDRRDASGHLRELHLEKAKRVLVAPYDRHTTDTAEQPANRPGGRRQMLVQGEFFSVVKHSVYGDNYVLDPCAYQLMVVTAGSGVAACAGVEYTVGAGDNLILPVGCDLSLSGRLDIIGACPAAG